MIIRLTLPFQGGNEKPLKMSSIKVFVLVSLGLVLAGCSTLRGGKGGRPRVEAPQAVSHSQEGIASWYGKGFRGRKTASGERFHPNDMTCAHRVFPFGTNLRVTNLSNQRQVVVRVNDRGPFIRSRIVDVSRAAAEALDFIGEGMATVRVEEVK